MLNPLRLPFHSHTDERNVDILGDPMVLESHNELSMVYGGGGVFGIAYCVGVAHGLLEAGIAVDKAPSLGTSAGSWAASCLALGIPFEQIEAMRVPTVPNYKPGLLHDIAHELFGDARHDLVAASAVCLTARRRHIFGGNCHPLADLVAASSAVPGLFLPHNIDGHLYMDGGMWSATSVDAATTADQVIVVAPLAGAVLGPMGLSAGFLLERELRTWRSRHPYCRITLIRPNRPIAMMAGYNPLGLFDKQRATDVYPLARQQGLRWGRRLLERPTHNIPEDENAA